MFERVQRGELGAGKAAVLAGWHRRAGRPAKPKQELEPTREPDSEPRPAWTSATPKRPELSEWPREVEEAELELAEAEVRVDRAVAEGALEDVDALVQQRRAATAKVERLKAAALNSTAVQVPLPEPHHGSRHS